MAAPSSPSVNNKMKLLTTYLSFFTTFIYLSPIYYASADDVVEDAATPPTRILTSLIHRDSIYSPYYNPNSTAEDRAKSDLKRSMIRLEYIQAKIQSNTNDYRAGLIAADTGVGFLVNISVGNPAVPQLVIMDTGSSLLWIQCQPCQKCFRQLSPIFDPSKSSTYANLSCTHSYCKSLTGSTCDQFNSCQYYDSYADGSYSAGNLAAEKLTLATSEGGTTNVLVVFGCGHENYDYARGNQTCGILGLGSEDVSLVSQVGSKFSYCIGNISDLQYSYNLLILGDEAVFKGPPSTLERYKGFYYVSLESISVGTRSLNINPTVFQRKPTGEGGVIIDSGTPYTILTKDAYEPLRDEVAYLLVKLPQISDPQVPSHLCFEGNIARDLQGFPAVTFHFAGGAQLVLDIGSFFREYSPNIFCMAVVMTSVSLHIAQEISLIGVMAQQNYNVGYDLRGNTISFYRVDCMDLRI